MNRKVLGLIAVIATILIVLFSVRGFNEGDKEKDVVISVPEATEQQEAVASVDDNKEEIAESDEVKEDEAFVSAGVEEMQQLKEEAVKENPLTEEQMIKIAQEQVKNFYTLGMVNSEEELKSVAKKFYYYYEEGLKSAKEYYDPGVSKNLKIKYEQETVTKNGTDTFTYVAITTPSADNIKTKIVDTFKQNITIDLKKGSDGIYKVIYLKANLIN